MLSRAAALGGDISTWNVSSVAGMYDMFRNAAFFKSDISKRDVSSVTDMSYMLYDAILLIMVSPSGEWQA